MRRRRGIVIDERARVPFALVGVVLLVGSATLAATMQSRDPPDASDPAVDAAMEEATAATGVALRTAIERAARESALSPVTARADTAAGEVLDPDSPFRDALRLRIYVHARRQLGLIDERGRGVRASAGLPATPNASALRRAKRRVHVAPAGPNGTALRVRIENVSVVARREGAVVGRERFTPTLVVRTPVLALHRRVERFEKRLGAAPTDPGLARRLTGRLFVAAWARGYAQYGGAPVENVVANRHVELLANGALLAEQRAAFGDSDPAGRRARLWATARVGLIDLLAGATSGRQWAREVLAAAKRARPATGTGEPPYARRAEAPGVADRLTVGVNRTADAAFVDLFGGNASGIVRSVYSASVRPITDVEQTGTSGSLAAVSPGPGWGLVETERRSYATASGSGNASLGSPRGWHELVGYRRQVTVTHVVRREWEKGKRTRGTSAKRVDRYDVELAMVGRHARSKFAPRRGIRTVHERGEGPLSGPNLADLRNRTIARVVEARGGPDALAKRAVTGGLDRSPATVRGERPPELRRWLYRDLVRLRERVRAVSTRVRRGEVGTFEATPAATLATKLRERRASLVDAPATYGAVADKARAAVRAAYLDLVLARLDRRAGERQRRRTAFENVLARAGGPSAGRLDAIVSTVAGDDPPDEKDRTAGLELRVDAAPSYLPLGGVPGGRLPPAGETRTEHPLVARNVNVFTVPYGDAADLLTDGLFRTDRTSLRSAAGTLDAADAALGEGNRSLADRRTRLRDAVRSANDRLRAGVRAVLQEEGVGDSPAHRRRIVDRGLSSWESPEAHARAFRNGSAARALARVAVGESRAGVRRDWLRTRLETNLTRSLQSSEVRPAEPVVERTARATRRVTKRELKRALASEGERASREALGRWANETFEVLPAGMPVAPAPGYWYATTNVWAVTVRGEYARFSVRARHGSPTQPGGSLVYVRENRTATLDYDEDGEAERLGRTERIAFEVETAVVVVVPPGRRGVGDVDGNADERSPGWPRAGPERGGE
ncbi:hypothetical protein BRC83_01565 [Halobacteriales archaeon QS_1_68_17]|nr:MAG: hypothetical protein BRC83_01565 [Halobacteriales archaeon QS_1_68_17]